MTCHDLSLYPMNRKVIASTVSIMFIIIFYFPLTTKLSRAVMGLDVSQWQIPASAGVPGSAIFAD
jgi:hypothetical protein